MLNKQLTNIHLLNTAKHKGLIKILVTGSLVLYSFIASQAYSIYQYKNINLNEYNTGLTVTRILIKELCLTVLREYIFTKHNGMESITYLLTPWSRVRLEKLTGSAACQEIPHIFGTRRFLTVLTSARHLSIS